jgi:hypothetical protein
MLTTLTISNFAQFESASIEFGDLTVLVGPQATGKSLALQTLKFAIDRSAIAAKLRSAGYDWEDGGYGLFSTYLGDGYEHSKSRNTNLRFRKREVLSVKSRSSSRSPKVFFIPAQRVVTISNGWPRRFDEYDYGDPFVVKEFSQEVFSLFGRGVGSGATPIFPNPDRLKESLRTSIEKSIFHGGRLILQKYRSKRQLVLNYGSKEERHEGIFLPFLEWSAGQREFTPLLLGLYGLLPAGKITKDPYYDWVVIEEPEMGLHPDGISTVVLLIFELLSRGYRVALSTHAPHVLDLVWAVQAIRESRSKKKDRLLVRALGHPESSALRKIATAVLKKKIKVHSLAFDSEGRHLCKDISSLDPFSEDSDVAGWGGLTSRSSEVARAVAKA